MSTPTYELAIEVLEQRAASLRRTALLDISPELTDASRTQAAELTEAADVLRRVAAITAALTLEAVDEPTADTPAAEVQALAEGTGDPGMVPVGSVNEAADSPVQEDVP